MQELIKILFFGDIVGKIGRNSVTDYLANNKDKYDFVIVNAENPLEDITLEELKNVFTGMFVKWEELNQ